MKVAARGPSNYSARRGIRLRLVASLFKIELPVISFTSFSASPWLILGLADNPESQ